MKCQGWQSSVDLCTNDATHYVIHKDWLPAYPTQGKYYCDDHTREYRCNTNYSITKRNS